MTNPYAHLANHPLASVPDLAADAVASAPRLTAAQADTLLQDEIRILRERGFSDECIHGLFSGFKIEARPEPSGSHWNLPLNDQLISLIWGKSQPISHQAD